MLTAAQVQVFDWITISTRLTYCNQELCFYAWLNFLLHPVNLCTKDNTLFFGGVTIKDFPILDELFCFLLQGKQQGYGTAL